MGVNNEKKVISIIFACVLLITGWGCTLESGDKKLDVISGYEWKAEDDSLLCLDTPNLLDIPKRKKNKVVALKYERSHSFGCCDLIKYLDST